MIDNRKGNTTMTTTEPAAAPPPTKPTTGKPPRIRSVYLVVDKDAHTVTAYSVEIDALRAVASSPSKTMVTTAYGDEVTID